MEKRREALEAYRRARREAASAGGGNSSSPSPVSSSAPAKAAPVAPAISSAAPARSPRSRVEDPAAHAAANYEKWMAATDIGKLVEHYGFLSNPLQRQKVMTWAVDMARAGDMRALLAIGIDDPEPSVRKHLNHLLASLPPDMLLSKVSNARFTIKERRTVAGLLGRCRDPRAGKLLGTMAAHDDSRVRESALQALAWFPVTPGLQLPLFKKHLETDSHPDVRLRAAEGLARLGTTEALITLEVASRRDEVTTPEIQSVLAAFQARLRPKSAYDPTAALSGKKERKPISNDQIVKICVLLAALVFASFRLSEPAKRWYNKKFSSPPAQVAK